MLFDEKRFCITCIDWGRKKCGVGKQDGKVRK
jgi:hypothetical protein